MHSCSEVTLTIHVLSARKTQQRLKVPNRRKTPMTTDENNTLRNCALNLISISDDPRLDKLTEFLLVLYS